MLQVIPTSYKGYRFRSRTEARWAVFFDAMGAQWEYEAEGYQLPDGTRYLPDFKVNDWLIEIKPTDHAGANSSKESLFAEQLRKSDLKQRYGIVRGAPGPIEWGDSRRGEFMKEPLAYWGEQLAPGGDQPFLFCLCPWCGKMGFEFDGRGARVCGWGAHHDSWETAQDEADEFAVGELSGKAYTFAHPRITAALNRARAARFEHGETP